MDVVIAFQRELQSDGTLSDRTLDVTAGLLARSALLLAALCNDDVSLHRDSSVTTVTEPLAPLYPESGLLLESTGGADFVGTGSTTTSVMPRSSGPVEEAGSSNETGSNEVTGTDVGAHSSLVAEPRFRSMVPRFRSAIRRPALSIAMQCFLRCRLALLDTVDSVSSERVR